MPFADIVKLRPAGTTAAYVDAAAERELMGIGHDALCSARILIADTAASTNETLRVLLAEAGYRHVSAVDRAGAVLQLLQRETPDLVLLDIQLGERAGLETLREIRAQPHLQQLPVIVLTGVDDADKKPQAVALGAADFLTKPIEPSDLTLRLRNTLAAKAYLDRLIYFDALTGLPNRNAFSEHFDALLRWAQHEKKNCALLLIDLDRFKGVNDSLGHTVGDQLLIKIAKRLVKCTRYVERIELPGWFSSRGILSRVGGDEFAVLLSDLGQSEDAIQLAERIRHLLSKPYRIADQTLVVTPSIGIAVFPDDGADFDTLFTHAGMAVDHVKHKGRNACQQFSHSTSAKTKAQLGMQRQLQDVAERGELLLYYQPKVDIRTGVITGCEALVRWQHPEKGLVSPAEFIWLAEEASLVSSIGEWTLATACAQNAAWQAAGLGALKISVNLSRRQLRDGQLVRAIQRALDGSRLSAEHLIVEFTEQAMIEDGLDNIDILQRIKALGVQISVDDFGTGFSALRFLEQLPLGEVKIDRAIVQKIDAPQADTALVSAVIAMAHSLRFGVVAEGVESEAQLDLLRERGCDEYQGFLFSKPLSADELSTSLSVWRPQAALVRARSGPERRTQRHEPYPPDSRIP